MTSLSYPKIEEYGQEPAPSTAKTVGLSLIKPFANSALFLNEAGHWALGSPLDEQMKQTIDVINYQLANPDIQSGQRATNTVAGLAGMVLDPISLALGGLGGKLLGSGARLATDMLPDSIVGLSSGALSRASIDEVLKAEIPLFQANKFAKYMPKNFHDVAERTAESAGMFAGFTTPESFMENYNADQNRLDWGGLAKSTTINGGIGLAFPPIMWTMGLIAGKIGGKIAEKELSAAERVKIAEQAHAEGKITPEELDFYKGVHERPVDVAEHHGKAQSILKKENHPVNALTGSVDFPFLTSEELTQLQSFSADEMASSNTVDYKDAMTQFVAHNALDRMVTTIQETPGMLEGIKGHLDAMVERLSKKVENLEKHDIYVEKTMTRAAEREQPLSQARLYDMMERGKLTEREMPFIVPENVKRIRKAERALDQMERTAKDYDREYAKSNRTEFKKKAEKTRTKIAEKRAKLDEYKKENGLKSQAQELKDIEKKFIGKEKLPDKYQIDNDYLRLLDLAHVYPQARKLIERIRHRAEYEQQQAIHDVMEGVVKIAEANLGKVSNPEKVINYLKERIETSASIPVIQKEMAERVTKVEHAAKRSAEQKESDIKEQVQAINDHADLSSDTKKEFNELYSRIEQFKGSEKALEDMVNCIMEAENVRI